MERTVGGVAEERCGTRRFRSPNRILARSFRLSRDKWKEKHQAVQAELEQVRQLAGERGASRDQWREQCKLAVARAQAADTLAAERLVELKQAEARLVELESALKKS